MASKQTSAIRKLERAVKAVKEAGLSVFASGDGPSLFIYDGAIVMTVDVEKDEAVDQDSAIAVIKLTRWDMGAF